MGQTRGGGKRPRRQRRRRDAARCRCQRRARRQWCGSGRRGGATYRSWSSPRVRAVAHTASDATSAVGDLPAGAAARAPTRAHGRAARGAQARCGASHDARRPPVAVDQRSGQRRRRGVDAPPGGDAGARHHGDVRGWRSAEDATSLPHRGRRSVPGPLLDRLYMALRVDIKLPEFVSSLPTSMLPMHARAVAFSGGLKESRPR